MGLRTRVLLVFTLFGLSNCYQDKTVYQYLVDNGYSSFVQLLKETHQDVLLQGLGPVTVFAPSNAAIARMNPDVVATMAHEGWQKSNLVKYHLVKDYILIPPLPQTENLMTTAGEKIGLLRIGHSLILNNNTRVDSPPHNDIVCNNGIVQPIDHVLLPPLYSTDNLVAILLERDELFQEFLMGVMLTNLTSLMENGEYTIFAPVNDAYIKFLQLLNIRPAQNASHENDNRIRVEGTKYHVVPGARTYDMLRNGEQLYTLHGAALNISTLISGKMVNQARIVHPDIAAANGIIHGIDDVLFPSDLLHLLPPEYRKYFVG